MTKEELEFLDKLRKNPNSYLLQNLLNNGSFEFLIEAVKIKPYIYTSIPTERRIQSYELSKVALEKGLWIRHIPREHDDYNMCLIAGQTNSMSFAEIPDQFKDQIFYDHLIKSNAQFYPKVPNQYLTPEMALHWAKRSHKRGTSKYWNNIEKINNHMPIQHKTIEFAKLLLENQPSYFPILSFLAHLQLDNDFYLEALRKNPSQIKFAPSHLKSNIKIIKCCLRNEKIYNDNKRHFIGYDTNLPYEDFKNKLAKTEIILKQL